MTPEDIKHWASDLGLTDRTAASALGMTLKNYQQLKLGKNFATGKPVTIDKRTALACAAIRAGLMPEGS